MADNAEDGDAGDTQSILAVMLNDKEMGVALYSEIDNIFDCLITSLPLVTLNNFGSPPNTKITSSLIWSLGLKYGVVNSYEEYESFVFNLLTDNGKSILIEYKHAV